MAELEPHEVDPEEGSPGAAPAAGDGHDPATLTASMRRGSQPDRSQRSARPPQARYDSVGAHSVQLGSLGTRAWGWQSSAAT